MNIRWPGGLVLAGVAPAAAVAQAQPHGAGARAAVDPAVALQNSWRLAGGAGEWVDAEAPSEGEKHFAPLEIVVPSELLLAMGIAAVSLIGAPILLSSKARNGASEADLDNSARGLGEHRADLAPDGQVFARVSAYSASWMDIFRGDDVGNAGAADLSKVQQVLITGLLIGVYCASLWSLFAHTAVVSSLPVVQERFVWLMGISHASYLAYKAAPHSRESDETSGVDSRNQPAG